MRRLRGFTLTELLVALVVASFASLAIYGTFRNMTTVSTQERAQGNVWQQARTALGVMSNAIEQAGYGLPVWACGQGMYSGNFNDANVGVTNPDPTNTLQNTVIGASASGGLMMQAIAWRAQTTADYWNYDPSAATGRHTYAFTLMRGGSDLGTGPSATISNVPSTSAANFDVLPADQFVPQIVPGDLFLAQLDNSTCILGDVTKPGPAVSNGYQIVANSGTGANPNLFNGSQGFNGAEPGVAASALQSSPVVNLGNAGFILDNFFIAPENGYPYAVPSLYLQQMTMATNNGSVPQPQLLARGVVDIQVQIGWGAKGSVTVWQSPSAPTPTGMYPNDVLAVKLQLLVRSTRPGPGTVTSVALLNGTYTVPTGLPKGPNAANYGCFTGSCTRYTYRTFDAVVPVRNDIWGQ